MQHGVNPKLSTNVNQDVLLEKVRSLFPGDQVHENVKKNISLKFPLGVYMELDIWIPKHKICFEFQDSYHYVSTWYSHISRERIQQKDNLKKNQTLTNGFDLITVPCWWDGTDESLASIIHFQRPDLISQSAPVPVTFNPPADYFKSPLIPDVGELMLASFPQKYPDFKSLITRNTWWMGEKYDGIRFCWHPALQKLYTRTVKELEVLPRLASLLPSQVIEGEIWFGRGEFSRSIMLLEGELTCWDMLRMNVFDQPTSAQSPFEMRYASLQDIIPPSHPFSVLVGRVACYDSRHVTSSVTGVVQDGGEGIILRKFDSLYVPGRSTDLVKLKTAAGDSEGIVTAIGKSGSVKVKLPTGEVFIVPSQNVLIPTPPLGAVVSFSYETHWRKTVPLEPKIYRVRTDISWEEVVQNLQQGWKHLNHFRKVQEKLASRPGKVTHWTNKNMRLFLENFARGKNMDPLIASTWRRLSYSEISRVPGGRTVLEKFKSGYFATLLHLFPELNVNKAEFRRDYWGFKGNRRKFFENYAAQKGFDALNPHMWYSQTMKQILNMKGGSALGFYNFNLPNALMDLFPNISFETAKFGNTYIGHDIASRRSIFEQYAYENQFDALQPRNWFDRQEKLRNKKTFRAVLSYYNNNLADALVHLFPQSNGARPSPSSPDV